MHISRLIFLLVAFAAPLAHAQPDLTGWWRADVAHNGETEAFYLHFTDDGQRQGARFSVPVARMHEVPVGAYRIDGATLEIPGVGWRVAIVDDGAALEGALPAGLVAGRTMPARFVRSDAAPPPPALTPRAEAPQPTWRVNLGAPIWGGLVHDAQRGAVYAATEAGAVAALSARTGAIEWRSELGAGVRAAPALDGDRLYVASDAALVALDASTGRQLWSAAFGSERAPRLPISDSHAQWDHYSSAAAVEGGVAYVGARDGCVYAFRAQDGVQLWRTCTENLITATPALDENALYIAGFDGAAYKLARDDGAILWRHETGAPIPRDPLIAGENVLVGSRNYDLIALNRETGSPVWTRHFWLSWVDSTPVLADGVVYIGSSDALAVQAFAAADGARLWSAHVPGWSWGAPAVGAQAIYAGAAGGPAYSSPREGGLAAIERQSGALRWLYRAEPAGEGEFYGFAAAPVVSDARLFAADLTGTVYAFDDSAS